MKQYVRHSSKLPLIYGCAFAVMATLAAVTPALAQICNSKAITINCAVIFPGSQFCFGTSGDDVIWGKSTPDIIFGGLGNDTICGNGGNDQLYASHQNAVVGPVSEYDRILGGSGSDTIVGNARGRLDGYGEAGNDIIHAGSMETQNTTGQFLVGGPGNNTLVGAYGDDVLLGDIGNDSLSGLAGNDYMDGYTGTDTGNGGAGNDVCLSIENPTSCEVSQ